MATKVHPDGNVAASATVPGAAAAAAPVPLPPVSPRSDAIARLVAELNPNGDRSDNEEIAAMLREIGVRVKEDRLAQFCGDRVRAADGTPNRQHPSAAVAAAAAASGAGSTLPLPSILSPRSGGGATDKVPSIRCFATHSPRTDAELERIAARLKIPRRNLAMIYQARVQPREEVQDSIFASSNAHLRNGETSIETKESRKYLPPAPARAPTNPVRPCGGTSPRAQIPPTTVVDVAPVEVRRPTFTSKIRETVLHTGKAIQTHKMRHIPSPQERFEASYGVLFRHSLA